MSEVSEGVVDARNYFAYVDILSFDMVCCSMKEQLKLYSKSEVFVALLRLFE